MRKGLLKKAVALAAIAAICWTMTTPMTASALDILVCAHANLGEECETIKVTDSTTHNVWYYKDTNGDGTEEIVLDTCTVISGELWLAAECKDCHEFKYIEKLDTLWREHQNVNCDLYEE